MNNESVKQDADNGVKQSKPRCVTAMLVSIDRMDNDTDGNIQLLLGLDFGGDKGVCYRAVSDNRIKSTGNYACVLDDSEPGIIGNTNLLIVGSNIWVLLEQTPKLYFYPNSTPLHLRTPISCSNDYLSLLVTKSNRRKKSIMHGQKIGDDLQIMEREDFSANEDATPRYIVVGQSHPRMIAVIDSHHPDYEQNRTENLHRLQPWIITSWNPFHGDGYKEIQQYWDQAFKLADLLNGGCELSKHTPVPWAYGEDKDGWYLEQVGSNTQHGYGLSEDDARRIVACVNAFDGIDLEKFEGKSVAEFVTSQTLLTSMGTDDKGGFGMQFNEQ